MKPKPIRTVENWYTVAVTALPAGWRNVCREDDGVLRTYQCPALLLQEFRSRTEHRETAEGRWVHSQVDMDPPYDTRVVFADHDHGDLDAVTQVSNYVGTVGPDEDPAIYSEADA